MLLIELLGSCDLSTVSYSCPVVDWTRQRTISRQNLAYRPSGPRTPLSTPQRAPVSPRQLTCYLARAHRMRARLSLLSQHSKVSSRLSSLMLQRVSAQLSSLIVKWPLLAKVFTFTIGLFITFTRTARSSAHTRSRSTAHETLLSPHRSLELLEVDLAAAVRIHLRKERIEILGLGIEAHCAHRLAELLLAHRVGPVAIPPP